MKAYEVWNCCPCTNTVRVLPNVKMRQTRAHTRGHVAGTIWRRQAPQRVETVPALKFLRFRSFGFRRKIGQHFRDL